MNISEINLSNLVKKAFRGGIGTLVLAFVVAIIFHPIMDNDIAGFVSIFLFGVSLISFTLGIVFLIVAVIDKSVVTASTAQKMQTSSVAESSFNDNDYDDTYEDDDDYDDIYEDDDSEEKEPIDRFGDVTSETVKWWGGGYKTTIKGVNLGAIWGHGNTAEEAEKDARAQYETAKEHYETMDRLWGRLNR